MLKLMQRIELVALRHGPFDKAAAVPGGALKQDGQVLVLIPIEKFRARCRREPDSDHEQVLSCIKPDFSPADLRIDADEQWMIDDTAVVHDDDTFISILGSERLDACCEVAPH